MERTEPEDAGAEGQSARPGAPGNRATTAVDPRRARAGGAAARAGPGPPHPEPPAGAPAAPPPALRAPLPVRRASDGRGVVGGAIPRRADAQEIAPGIGKMLEKIVADGG